MSNTLPTVPPIAGQPQQGLSFNQQGSISTPVYWGEDMNIYPVSEDRLDNISSFSGAAAFCFSIGSLFAQDALKAFSEKSFGCISQLEVQVLLVFYIAGLIFWHKRGNTIKQMKKNCRKLNAGSSNAPQGSP